MNYRDSVALPRWTSPEAASALPLHLGDGQRGEISKVLSVLGGLRGLARRVPSGEFSKLIWDIYPGLIWLSMG